ncbi:N-acetylglucosaminyldiphosphoundecaprenol N-acetyl-beta-D-mannosaminyltransferase [biofilm metagenome]
MTAKQLIIDMDINKDFSRNVWCILGLPFDTITLEQAAQVIVSAVNTRSACYLCTPNVNFICTAKSDVQFRQSIINSDLSIVDGFPIVFVAKLLGIPMPERIGGSNLIEYLYNRQTATPIKVYFFGGENGVGELASNKINQQPAGLVAVGHYAPGFGSVDEMSTPDIINSVNNQSVEFLMVSLGAKKGQAWIERNRHRVNSTVIGYMGAVINFFAGTVKRAPDWMQSIGVEWIWRIYQEPNLWRRYYDDGICFLKLFFNNVIPYWIWQTYFKPKTAKDLTIKESTEAKNTSIIELSGDCTSLTILPLRETFKKLANKKSNVNIDLKDVRYIDSAFLGLCLILYKHLKPNGLQLKFINPNKAVSRIIKWQNVNDIFF